jgi:hypothetical protein
MVENLIWFEEIDINAENRDGVIALALPETCQ